MSGITAAELADRLDGLSDEAREAGKQLRASQRDKFEVGYIRGAILAIAKDVRALEKPAPKGSARNA